MGKCPPSSSSMAAGYLTLRSGRRVPAATSCSPTSRRQCRGSSRRRCGVKSAAGVRQRCRVVISSSPVVHSRPEHETPAQASNTVVRDDDGCGDSRQDTLHSGEESKKQRPCEGRRHRGSADTVRRSPPEAEIEAFFAAAELAERRRFAETYNYDVALDRPLEGRFEWTPVST